DDYSRMVTVAVVLPVTTAADVVAAFYQGAGRFGLPASMLTDNGCIFTAELQVQHIYFGRYYNETRPHSARGIVPPRKAFDALAKASPDPDKYPMAPHTRVRHDRIDKTG